METVANIGKAIWTFQSEVSRTILGYDFIGDLTLKAKDAALTAVIVPVLALVISIVVAILVYFFFFDISKWTLEMAWKVASRVILLLAVITGAFITFLLVMRLATPHEETIAQYVKQTFSTSPPPPPQETRAYFTTDLCDAWLPEWACSMYQKNQPPKAR